MSGAPDRLVRLKIADIKVADRLRPVDADWAAALAGSIAREGLLSPIDVCAEGKGYRLVAGAHRIAAMQLLGRDEIDAFVRDHEALGRRAREIAENIMRRELDPLDRAAFVAELYEVGRQRAGVTQHEHSRKLGGMAKAAQGKFEAEDARANFALAYNLQEQVADKIGLSVRTIKNELAIHRGLKPAAVALLRGTKTAQAASQLLSLAKRSETEQIEAAKVIADGKATSASNALRIVTGGRAPTPQEAKLDRFIALWASLGAHERGKVLDQLSRSKLPAGWVIEKRGKA